MSDRSYIHNDDIMSVAKQIEQLPGELKTNLLNQYGITAEVLSSAGVTFEQKVIQSTNLRGNYRSTYYALDDKSKMNYMLACFVIKSRNAKGASAVKDYFNGNASALELIRALRSHVHFVPSADDGKNLAEEKVTPPSKSVTPSVPAPSAPVEPALDPVPVPADDELEPYNKPIPGIGIGAFMDLKTAQEVLTAEPEPYLIEDFIRKGTLVAFVAESNSGKTNFAMDMCAHVASGADYLPKPDGIGNFTDGFTVHPGACIYLDFEGDLHDTASRFVAVIEYQKEITGKDDIPFLVYHMPTFIGSSSCMPNDIYTAITTLPEQYRNPALVMFDTYGAFANLKNEDDNAESQRLWNNMKQLKVLFPNTVFGVLMHTRKLNERKTNIGNISIDDIRGASASAGALSDVWYIQQDKDEPDVKLLKQIKAKGRQRDPEIKRIQMFYEHNDDGTFSTMHFGLVEGTTAKTLQEKNKARRQSSNNKKKKAILEFVNAHPGCSISYMCRGENRLKMAYETAQKFVDELIAEGKLINSSDTENATCLTAIG
jgi:hypothetical protein